MGLKKVEREKPHLGKLQNEKSWGQSNLKVTQHFFNGLDLVNRSSLTDESQSEQVVEQNAENFL